MKLNQEIYNKFFGNSPNGNIDSYSLRKDMDTWDDYWQDLADQFDSHAFIDDSVSTSRPLDIFKQIFH